MENTRKAEQIDFGPNPIIHTVQIADMTNQEIDAITSQIGLYVPHYVKADTWMVTRKIPDGETLMAVMTRHGVLQDGTKLAADEIDDMINQLKIMRNAGINHTDLERNTFIHRDSSGKLQAYILDFEDAGASDTDYIKHELNNLKKHLEPSQSRENLTITGQ